MRGHGLRIEMPGETVEVAVRAHDLCEVTPDRGNLGVLLELAGLGAAH